MEKETMGKIALELVRMKLEKDGFPSNLSKNNFERSLGNFSKRTGIPVSELKEFCSIMLQEYTEKLCK